MATYKCGNKECKNNGIVERDIAVKIKTRYYCPECAEEVNGKASIRDKYKKEIDAKPNVTQLNLAIKKLINEYECDIDLVLYAISYVKANKIRINNPFGLTWVVKDDKMIKQYDKEIKTKKANIIRETAKNEESHKSSDICFTYKPSKPKWMRDIK